MVFHRFFCPFPVQVSTTFLGLFRHFFRAFPPSRHISYTVSLDDKTIITYSGLIISHCFALHPHEKHGLIKPELVIVELDLQVGVDHRLKAKSKYTVNGLRLQANVASAVLTQIVLECTCSVPKMYIQCRLNVGCIYIRYP